MPYSSGTESESALFWLRGFGGAAFLTLDGLRLVGWEVLCQAVLPAAGRRGACARLEHGEDQWNDGGRRFP